MNAEQDIYNIIGSDKIVQKIIRAEARRFKDALKHTEYEPLTAEALLTLQGQLLIPVKAMVGIEARAITSLIERDRAFEVAIAPTPTAHGKPLYRADPDE